MEDPDPRNGGWLLGCLLSNLTTDQMLAAWDQLQDADLEDAADVIFAQVHPGCSTQPLSIQFPATFNLFPDTVSYFQFKKPRFPDEVDAGLLYAEHMIEVG